MSTNKTAISRRGPAALLRHAAMLGLSAVPFAAPAAETVTTVAEDEILTTPIVADVPAASDTHVINNAGTIRGPSANPLNPLVISGSGAGRVTINNDGRLQGRIDFSAATGGVVLNNNAGIDNPDRGWYFQVNNDALRVNFSAGDDVLNNGANGLISNQSFGAVATRIDFGDGNDTFNNAGRLLVGGGRSNGNLTLSGLETFSNSGSIVLGGELALAPGSITNRLVMPGTHFVGLEGSRIALDAWLDGFIPQNSCPETGPREADCINLAGGSTSGVTQLTVYGTPAARGGSYSTGLALVDVSGGTSHAGDFVLDPASPGYAADEAFGGGIQGPDIFVYSLLYHEPTQTHRLVGLPNRDVLSLGVLPVAAQTLWRTADKAASARQAELRSAPATASGGFWFKASGGSAERDSQAGLSVFGQTDTVDANYEQSDRAFTFGADVVGSEGESGYAFGISLGDVRSDVEFQRLANRAELGGLAVNVYGSYRKGWFFLDLSGGGYSGDLEGTFVSGGNAVPLKSSVNVFGLRTEAGSQLRLTPGFSVQPLLSLVYVRSGLSDVKELPGASLNAVVFESATSLRGGGGARAVLDLAFTEVKLGLSLAARYWEEFDGASRSTVRTQVDPFTFSNDFDGGFGEAEVAVDLTALDGRLSSYLSLGGQFGDDYESQTASLGVRYNW